MPICITLPSIDCVVRATTVSPQRTNREIFRWPGRALWIGILGASLAFGSAAQVEEASRGPDQYASHDLEVRLDKLPDTIAADDIELVLESSDEFCKPKPSKLLGLVSWATFVPHSSAYFCKHVNAYVGTHQGPLPLKISRKAWMHRQPADQVRDLDVPLARRYVLLSRWRAYDSEIDNYATVRRVRWVAEEVLWDRQSNRVLWHSLRSIYCDDHYKQGSVWGMQIELRRHFSFRLPAILTARGVVRQHSTVVLGRWVPTAEIEGWRSESRAAIAFVNNYSTPRDRFSLRDVVFAIRAEGQEPLVSEPYVAGNDDSMRKENLLRAGFTPPMDIGTYALLEVPAGRYVTDTAWARRDKPIELDLKAGEFVVVEYARAMVGADLPKVVDIGQWKKTVARGPHAFLEDGRVLPAQWQVETWFSGY